MILSRKTYEALDWAISIHKNDARRPFKNYMVHCIQVRDILVSCGETDEDVFCIAHLHDAQEDHGVTFDKIAKRFGDRVARGVAAVTDDVRLPRKVQKRLQIKSIANKSLDALKVKMADRICNVRSETGGRDSTDYTDHSWLMYDEFKNRRKADNDVLQDPVYNHLLKLLKESI